MSKEEKLLEPLDFFIWTAEELLMLLLSLIVLVARVEEVECKQIVFAGCWVVVVRNKLGGYRQVFKENGVNGEYLEGMSMFTTEQILRFVRRRCHMKWSDFITLCKELHRIKVACLTGEQKVRRPLWAPSCHSVFFLKVAKLNNQS